MDCMYMVQTGFVGLEKRPRRVVELTRIKVFQLQVEIVGIENDAFLVKNRHPLWVRIFRSL